MEKVRYYDCLNCKEYDSVVAEYEVTSKCLQIHISKCTSCGQFHTLDYENNLVKFDKSQSPIILKTETVGPVNVEYNNGYRIETLQEGDWFIGMEEQYKKVLELEYHPNIRLNKKAWIEQMNDSYCIFHDSGIYWSLDRVKKTKLTPEEFLRRAENTFKTK